MPDMTQDRINRIDVTCTRGPGCTPGHPCQDCQEILGDANDQLAKIHARQDAEHARLTAQGNPLAGLITAFDAERARIEAAVEDVEFCDCTNTELEAGRVCAQPQCPNKPRPMTGHPAGCRCSLGKCQEG